MKVQPLNQTALQVSWSQPETVYHPPIMNYMISYSWTKNEDEKEKTFTKDSDKDLVKPRCVHNCPCSYEGSPCRVSYHPRTARRALSVPAEGAVLRIAVAIPGSRGYPWEPWLGPPPPPGLLLPFRFLATPPEKAR